MAAALSNLPAEVLCDVFQQLDPISLISLSQTSSRFRSLIQPTREDLVQRLLALELLPEAGGITPIFQPAENSWSPPCTLESPEWRANRYACCVCLRLRHHMWFDRRSITNVRTRKPLPGSREATKLTTWEPFNRGMRQRRARERTAEEWEDLGLERDDYHYYCNGWTRFNRGGFVDRGVLAEVEICGTERHKRACIECRQARGDLRTLVVKSREVPFTDGLERHFPGLINFLMERKPSVALLPPRRPLPIIGRRRQDTTHFPCALYVAFCSSCEGWYELSGFLHDFTNGRDLCWNGHSHHKFPSEASGICINCASKAAPEHAVREISGSAIHLAEEWAERLRDELAYGWTYLLDEWKEGYVGFQDMKAEYPRPMRRILSLLRTIPSVKTVNENNPMHPTRTVCYNEGNAAIFRIKRFEFVQLLRECPERLVEEIIADNKSFMKWLDLKHYALREKAFLRFKKVGELIREEPDLVLQYFETRKPHELPR
ncbi:hypothetical protein QBC34DRAFT_465594 [Podospora aff. communis PSN243]|uniref:F-box domain-containing protein n=1 Tax=Podospora aff. communis PSN243 TaxID=3040156 RepID=A0AAV9GMU1_9PEZI|nr:hypothetical protein QBC34DRAFT_465594 [Podospora aff. communis PSN243]